MPRILVLDCKQEISTFNPLPSGYETFTSPMARNCWRIAA